MSDGEEDTTGVRMSQCFLMVLYSVESWNLYLCARQMESIARHGLPDVLEGHVSKETYNKIRLRAAVDILTRIAVRSVRLYAQSTIRFTASAIHLWHSTASVTGNIELRAITWAFLDDLMDNLVFLPLLLLVSVLHKGGQAKPIEVLLGGAALLLFHAAGAAVKTLILLRAIKTYGKKVLICWLFFLEIATIVANVTMILILVPTMYQPIPEGPYRTEIDAVCQQAGYYPNHGVYLEPMKDGVVDQPNAYHAGILGTSMIVVSESLLKIVSPKDIAAVVAHELGHWNGCHSIYGFLANLAANVTFTIAAMWSYGNEDFFDLLRFDQADPPHPILGVLLFGKYLYPSIGNIIIGVKHTAGYFCEYSADSYAFKMGLGTELAVSLIRLFEKILHFPHGDPWYTAWTTAHPSIVRRIENINELKGAS